MHTRKPRIIGLALCVLFLAAACSYYISQDIRKDYKSVNELLHSERAGAAYLKAHTKDGSIYVLEPKWGIDSIRKSLSGRGKLFDFNRNLKSEGTFNIPFDSIVIFETNQQLRSKDDLRIAALAVVTALDIIIGVYCLMNPKACFGSCPTFYYLQENNLQYASAEGFSASICPALEEGDIDALNNPVISDGLFTLTMKNEALETHAVNQVNILAAPRRTGCRIFQSNNGHFFRCSNIRKLSSAFAPEGDVRRQLESMDNEERFSKSDSNDLSAKENININFRQPFKNGASGLLINFRQTLMTTFLLYSAYGYMGDEVSDMLAKAETDKSLLNILKKSYDKVGGIEVYIFSPKKHKWIILDTIFETGPIAKNLQIVRLPGNLLSGEEIKIRLRMSKGLWRIDYAAIAAIEQEVHPLTIQPYGLTRNNIRDDQALTNLMADDKNYQVSMPGDVYKLFFSLPDKEDYELFVYSKGFYLEWIRKEWLKEKNIAKLKRMLAGDKVVWHALAREYKVMEPSMESTFWNSKIANR